MQLRVHHGAAEIGGNCIELSCGTSRLLLDLGLPLQSGHHGLPPVSGLTKPDSAFLGVVLSHPHLDHYGLLPLASPTVPVWLGEGAARLLEAAAPFARGATLPQAVTSYRSNEPFDVGPFRITPYLMDHSAYDAHALLVEAAGKRLFYSGDFRGHGRKAKVFERFLADPPRDVDLLLMEGTTLARDTACVTETDVEDQALGVMQETSGIVLTCFSGQNIDRFVTFLRASMRADRMFIADAYMANLISALDLPSLPRFEGHASLRVYLPQIQKRMIVASGQFELIERYRQRRIFREEILARPADFTMIFRSSMAAEFGSAELAGGSLIYSLWPGYLERDRVDLRRWAHDRSVAFHIIHSSGHAHRDDLVRLAESIAPKRLMPIHTDQPARYGELYGNVQHARNGQWVEV